MEFLGKIERQILTWVKSIPHLPPIAQKWLGDNIWWIALVSAILTGISVLILLVNLLNNVTLLGTVAAAYFATSTFTVWVIITGIVSLVFAIIESVLLALSVAPLKEKQKKGWVLLFATWLVGAVGTVVSAVLTLNPFSLITAILFGAIWLAITGYFIFEMHGQFAHVERSKGVKRAKTSKTSK